jgi:hypothetical protein
MRIRGERVDVNILLARQGRQVMRRFSATVWLASTRYRNFT